MMLSKGGRPRKTGYTGVPVNFVTLKDLKLTKRESSEAQKLARMPDVLFEAIKNRKISRKAAFEILRGLEKQHDAGI